MLAALKRYSLIGTHFFTIVFSIAGFNSCIFAQEKAERTEATYLNNVRQLMFEGKRSGEGYYSADGKLLVFQSERQADNPFYQIYLQDLETGDITRVSPGYGKTTCAWVHPNGTQVLYASTQFDEEAKAKQQAELEFRASGLERRYSWDYDPEYELVLWDSKENTYKRLTNVPGYDAECAISPDGKKIVFASNRRAYNSELSNEETELFKIDPASAMDIYIMDIDGSNVQRLTSEVGYDGGPFFSPNGQRICWRQFNKNGATAEIFTMKIDGSDVKRLTSLNAMSWAPFYHPSGDYLIFTTNLNGFANFELYMVDAAGKHEPVRVTYTDGFDGLPVFSPNGDKLTWSSTRTASQASQLFTADWNDAAARVALGLERNSASSEVPEESATLKSDEGKLASDASSSAMLAAKEASKSFSAADVGRHIDYLCRPELGGRLTGTAGERAASAYVAAYMEQLGLEPAFQNEGGISTYTQSFPFVAGIEIGKDNRLAWNQDNYEVNKDWRPLALSVNGTVDPTPVVFAGYGIVAPKGEAVAGQDLTTTDEYDSYVHLDVQGKWVLVFRQMPMDITTERRGYLARFSSLRYKAMVARERGAKGLIVVSGPTSEARSQLVPLTTDGSLSGSQIAAISITDAVAESWFKADDKDLKETQKAFDTGDMQMGFELANCNVSSVIDVEPIETRGQNTVGWIACDDSSAPTIIVGAHIDHLGSQAGNNSLAKEDEKDQVHRGADDNASGISGMLEIAEYITNEVTNGRLKLKSNIMFAAWSGEELGLLGSAYFIDHLPKILDAGASGDLPEMTADEIAMAHAHGMAVELPPRKIAAYFNLDMVGRLRENLVLQGTGSSPIWRSEIEQRNTIVGLPLVLQDDSYLPTDASTFYMAGVPILSAFTGQHSEYHTPRDVPQLINFEGAAKTSQLLGLIVRSLASSGAAPDYVQQASPENSEIRVSLSAYLGTIPDYAAGDISGVKLSGVSQGAPAEKAGLKGDDVIIELAGRKITNIYDYTYAIESLRIGQTTSVVVKRGDEEIRLDITPSSRQ